MRIVGFKLTPYTYIVNCSYIDLFSLNIKYDLRNDLEEYKKQKEYWEDKLWEYLPECYKKNVSNPLIDAIVYLTYDWERKTVEESFLIADKCKLTECLNTIKRRPCATVILTFWAQYETDNDFDITRYI